MPLGLGLVYLAAAGVGGKRGGYWGAAVVWLRESRPELDTVGVYLVAVGLAP